MEQGTWDILISGGVIGGLILMVWARVSGMTIPELIKEIRDIFQDSSEDVQEVVWYE